MRDHAFTCTVCMFTHTHPPTHKENIEKSPWAGGKPLTYREARIDLHPSSQKPWEQQEYVENYLKGLGNQDIWDPESSDL